MEPQDLVEIEAIKQLKYRYMRCIDQKGWGELAGCFTDDATAAYSGGKYTFEGRDAILAFLQKSMGAETFLSSHRVSQPEIELHDAAHATGTWALADTVIETQWQITIRGAAFYTDRYRKEDGVWRIEHTGYRRTYEEIENRKDTASLRITASWWGTDGQSELEVPS